MYYLGNKLYIDPYLAWLQDSKRHKDEYLPTLASEVDNQLSNLKDLKRRIGLGLVEIEREAFGDGDVVETSSTSGSESDSSDSDDEDSDSDSDEEDSSSGEHDNEAPVGIKVPGDDTTSATRVGNSPDLLDENIGGVGSDSSNINASSLIVEMSKLSVKGDDGDDRRQNAVTVSNKLIEELN